ncbi:type II toxin-antitoxin system RelE/ParE family toxin [Mitsuokella sp. oral taxon 131]|uniref:type II toxin-antitoxin system RelE/ParE family toxin n=1 Tax=Mitsuokella sp. oral taxon 131 TaxID=1321780 RepID=UPI0003AE1E0B|nr:type II toxin-antitoxin system RelE/ParE family toxin [Mitsuokella sp. oral taxon 131]ERL04315.1 toxin-antitoxin system, toxin component, RelE family [Mitsuokella sp. oral taxon 131 str. W9106]
MGKFEIAFYETISGNRPAEAFLLGLDAKMRAKLVRTIQLLSVNGNQLREPYSKELTDKIFELRAKVGSDISRVLYFFVVGRRIILTHGFIKKTRKTPTNEIERAKRYRQDYMERTDAL